MGGTERDAEASLLVGEERDVEKLFEKLMAVSSERRRRRSVRERQFTFVFFSTSDGRTFRSAFLLPLLLFTPGLTLKRTVSTSQQRQPSGENMACTST